MVADIGDISINTYNIIKSCELIREQVAQIISNGCIPLIMGGDHTVTYPILQAFKVFITFYVLLTVLARFGVRKNVFSNDME